MEMSVLNSSSKNPSVSPPGVFFCAIANQVMALPSLSISAAGNE